ncbi:MAG TPA: ABC transporter permease [Vicinamibacterales bacterium]|nr:ABC transporter permease [Vicinamibacterales bacterium]
MGAFLLRRFVFAVVLLVCTSSTALLLTRLAPGDLTSQLGPIASRSEIETTRARFDLDRSPLTQWALWATRAIRLDFGDSFLFNRPVGPLVVRAAGNTAALAVVALAIATLLGISLGILTGSRQGSRLAAFVGMVSMVCVSLPPLLTSLVFVFIAARTGWLPAGGMSSAGASDMGWVAWIADVAWHLPLPALALAVPIAAVFERLQSQSMADAVRQPFVIAAVARGVPSRDLILRHAWPASVRPLCAVYGLVIGALLSGSFIVEYVTSWPGLGQLMYQALRGRDVYLVAACAAMGAVFLAVGTLAGDLLLAAADPRVREGDGA